MAKVEKKVMVEVRWVDSCSTPGWHNIDDLNESLDEHTFASCINVGYLFRETGDYIALVSAFNATGNEAETLFIIPKCCVQSVTTLRRRG